MHSKVAYDLTGQRKLSMRHLALYASLIAFAIAIACLLIFLFFPEIYLNKYFKHKIIKEFTRTYPKYKMSISTLHYDVNENLVEFGGLAVNSKDSNFSFIVDKAYLKGISWLKLIWKGKVESGVIAGSAGEAEGIAWKFRESRYELRCEHLKVSLLDSEIVVNDLKMNPFVDDEQFFEDSKYRKIRYRLLIPKLKVCGLGTGQPGKEFHARYVEIEGVSLDILINKYKPFKKVVSKTLMPNELFSSMDKVVDIDSILIIDGQIDFGRAYSVRTNPAIISFDNVELLATGISKHDTLVVHTNAKFMNAGIMKAILSIPFKTKKFNMQYSGSLSRMELNKLNTFLETANHIRIKSGRVDSASYDILVVDGNAKGSVRGEYKDLKIALLDERTGSEKGKANRVKSLFANTFMVNSTNLQDKTSSFKLGKVQYSRQRDESFIEFLWYSLNTGVGSVVGY